MRKCNSRDYDSGENRYSNYQCRVMEYQEGVDNIRRTILGASNEGQSNGQIFGMQQYNRFLGDNDEILAEMREKLLQGENLMVADTGSGKTRTLYSLTNEQEWNIGIFIFWSLTDQVSNVYNTQRLVGGDRIDIQSDPDNVVISSNKRMAVLIDVCAGLEYNMRALQNKGLDWKKEKGIVWVDESHLIAESASYRPRAVRSLLSFLKFIREDTGLGIVYTTATPNTCQLLPYSNLYFYDRRVEECNIKDVSEYICGDGEDIKDIVLTAVRHELSIGHKVILRVNNKQFIENLSEQIPNFELITGDCKDSVAYDDISKRTLVDFSRYDVIALTCVLDAGISINTVKGCEIDDITNIFVVNEHVDMVDLKQFSNRLRFDSILMILVARHKCSAVEDTKTFEEMVNTKGLIYGKAYSNYLELEKALMNVYKDRKMVSIKMRGILAERDYYGLRNDMGVFGVNSYTGELEYNYFNAFIRIYNEYQSQFFFCDELRHNVLKDVFVVDEIQKANIGDCQAQYVDVIDAQAVMVLNDIVENEEMQDAIRHRDDKGLKTMIAEVYGETIKDVDKILNDKKFEKMMALSRYESVAEAAKDVVSMKASVLGKKMSRLERKRIRNLEIWEVADLERYIENDGHYMIDNGLRDIVNGKYYDLYYEAYHNGIRLGVFQEIVSECGIDVARDYIREETVIRNNKRYESNRKLADWTGWAGYEQSLVIAVIDKCRTGSTVKINDITMGKIQKLLKRRTGQKWALSDVESFIKMIYVYKNVDGGLQLQNLRKTHTSRLNMSAGDDFMDAIAI